MHLPVLLEARRSRRPASDGRYPTLRRDSTGYMQSISGAGIGLAWIGVHSVRGRTVQVETVTPGSGPLVTSQDGVLIEYEGRLENGKTFDSSAGKGPVPVLASQTIPGFAEALMRM